MKRFSVACDCDTASMAVAAAAMVPPNSKAAASISRSCPSREGRSSIARAMRPMESNASPEDSIVFCLSSSGWSSMNRSTRRGSYMVPDRPRRMRMASSRGSADR